jgi:uncharacterized cupredoxin-like copper-binding protein
MRSRRAAALAALSLGTFAVAVPASASVHATAASTSVTVTAGKPSEFRFTLSTKSVKHGKVTFKIVNKGHASHDFSIGGKKSSMVKPGKSTTLTVNLSKGSKAYKCTVPGHAAAGMKGTLKVS